MCSWNWDLFKERKERKKKWNTCVRVNANIYISLFVPHKFNNYQIADFENDHKEFIDSENFEPKILRE